MKNYIFCTEVLVRMPLLDGHVPQDNLAAVLQRNDFRAALFLASRSFYNELSKREFDYTLLSDKQKQTIKKYLNRARFRSTPFGLFASVSLINWEDANEGFEFGELEANIDHDFRTLYELWERHLDKYGIKAQTYQTNASLYMNGIDYRYFKKHVDGNCISFSMVSVERDRLLKSLLQFCKTSRTWEEIKCFLTEKNIPFNSAEAFIDDLIREQILVSGLSPNITGRGYDWLLENFKKNGRAIEAIDVQTAIKVPASQVLQHILSAASSMDHYLDKPCNTNYFYCISERKLRGSLNRRYQKSIEEGLHCLTRLSQSSVNKDLQAFVTAFEKKYESEEIPLLQALDPQFGIGYGGLDNIKANYGFFSAGYDVQNNQTSSHSPQNGIASWLMNECYMSFNYTRELEITDQQLERLTKTAAENPAPSLSVIFRTLNDKIVIESAGGVSALALIGRFCISDDVYRHAQFIAKEEQLQNKNVVFAEIAHLCNLHTANINRRPHFYEHEIPVLTGSILPQNKQVPLSDLMVSVREGQVYLRSKKLKKQIVPRLSSAFNYSRNDLPVFRFLCDLQGQGINAHLNFSLASIMPGLPFYPRVTYKSCILQLAEWHIDVTRLQKVRQSKDPFAAFQQLSESVKLPNYFSYCVGDNFLLFNRDQEDDIQLFLKEAEQQKAVVLKEFPFISASRTQTCSEPKSFPQYIASMVLQKEVYHPQPVFFRKHLLKSPANDWVYFKLYCHPLSSDIILGHHLFPLIEKLKEDKLVLSWFWVRYNDPEYHLRIRARVKPNSRKKLIQIFSVCFEKLCSGKLASHFQTDRYKRELERYSPQLIQHVEKVFQASSECIAASIKEQNDLNYEDPGVMLNAVLSGAVILNAFAIPDQADICKKAFEGFFTEFNAPKDLKTEMEKSYRRLEKEIDGLLYSSTEGRQFECLVQSIHTLVSAHHAAGVKEVPLQKLALDIIHMHLNRLFIYNQRYFEMIHYYLLQRALYKQKYKVN